MKIKKLCAGLFALGMAFSLMLPTPVRAAEAASGITTNAVPGWPQGADITSTAAVVMEESTNTIVYAKNMDQQLFSRKYGKDHDNSSGTGKQPAYRSGYHDCYRRFRRY